jgi:hypothetical protein
MNSGLLLQRQSAARIYSLIADNTKNLIYNKIARSNAWQQYVIPVNSLAILKNNDILGLYSE